MVWKVCWPFPNRQKRALKYFQERLYMERNTDVSYSFTPPSDEEEALEYVKEGDQTIFIGAIGIFDDEWNITPLNSEATKKFGIEPNFVTRRSELEFAARCTCRISRMLDGGNPQDATAFFISPTLLTAGHVASGKDRILGQKPGKFKAEIADDVFAATTPAADVLKFRTVATLYRGKGRPGSIDINVLKVTSRYRATTWITMDTAARVPKDTTVDLLGYPGDYSQTYLSKLLGITINSDQEWNQIRAIVPAHRLIVSHGKVLEENDRVIYKLSTTGGMSGGPVMYNKKAVGIHSGGNGNGHNKCIPLCNQRVKELIEAQLRNENKPSLTERIKAILPPMRRTASVDSKASTSRASLLESPEIVESV